MTAKSKSSCIAKTDAVARKIKKGPMSVKVKAPKGIKSQMKQIGKKGL